jgi:hypothetical protein
MKIWTVDAFMHLSWKALRAKPGDSSPHQKKTVLGSLWNSIPWSF